MLQKSANIKFYLLESSYYCEYYLDFSIQRNKQTLQIYNI